MNSRLPEEGARPIDSGAQEMVGYVVDMATPDGGARVTLDLDARHINRVGSLHGGIVAMLLDAAAGFAAARHWAGDEPDGEAPQLVTVSLNIHYVASADAGRVVATGRVSGGGRTLAHAEAELRHEDGRLLATASGVFRRVRGQARP